MDEPLLHILFFEAAKKYISELKSTEQAKIAAHIDILRTGDFQTVHTKQLEGPVRELIVGHHRFVYFKKQETLYVVDAFRKKSAKTPKNVIRYARDLYKAVT